MKRYVVRVDIVPAKEGTFLIQGKEHGSSPENTVTVYDNVKQEFIFSMNGSEADVKSKYEELKETYKD